MADKTVSLKIKVTQASETKKALDSLNMVSTNWDKVFGKNGDKVVKNQERHVGALTKSWESLGSAVKSVKDHLSGFGPATLNGLSTFTRGVEGATKKVFNLKTALAATAVGGAAIWGVKAIFEEGAQKIKTRKRLAREFGSEAKDIEGAAKGINFKAGITEDDASRGLIPLAEQLQAIQGGSQFRGMKKPLTDAQALALRKKNLNFGADLFGRVATLVPDLEPEELGRVLGDALAGPEGIRSMVSALHLSKRSKTLSAANEKGQAFKALTPEERKKYGVSKSGQYLEQGDLVNLLLERSGLTDKAAQDEQKTFSHQIKQIKSTLMGQISDIGSGALDTLTQKLGQGATAAERLQGYLKSDEGKKTMESVKDSVVAVASTIATIVKDLPAIGAWLKEHKTLLEVLAGAYLAAKAAPTIGGAVSGVGALVKGGKAVAGVGGTLGTLVKGAAGATGLVAAGAAAGYLGYKAGSYLDKHSKVAAKGYGVLANGLYSVTGEAAADKKQEEFELGRNQDRIKEIKAKKDAMVRSLESRGIGHGLAVRYAEHPEEMKGNPNLANLFKGTGGGDVNVTTNLVVDGQVLARITEKHLAKNMKNRTANGAAPVTKGT